MLYELCILYHFPYTIFELQRLSDLQFNRGYTFQERSDSHVELADIG